MRAWAKVLPALVLAASVLVSSGLAQERAEVKMEIEMEIERQLGELELADLERLLRDSPRVVQAVAGGEDLGQMLSRLAAGEEVGGFDALWDVVKNAVRSRALFILTVLAVAIIGGIVAQTKGKTGELGAFACSALGVIAAVFVFTQTVITAREAMETTAAVLNAAFPPMLVLLTVSSPLSSGVFQPVTAMLTGAVSSFMTSVMLPLVLTSGVIAVIGAFSSHISFDKLGKTVNSAIKWCLGAVTTLFIGVCSIKGIAARTYDGVGARTARYTLDKLIPYVGSLVSGSVDAVAGVALIVKNALGACALLIMLAYLAAPLAEIAVTQLSLRLLSAAAEPLGDARLAKTLDKLGDVMAFLFAIVAAQGLMAVIMVGLIIQTGMVI